MSPRAARLALAAFTAFVAASIGVALAGLTWRLLGDPGRRLDAAPPAAAAAAPVDVAPLIALAPFGTGGGTATGAAAAPDLVLRGILLATPREASTAIIQAGSATPVAVSVGQPIGAATVAAIEADHVVLLAPGGARQTLPFPRPAGGDTPSAPVLAPPPPLAPGAPPPPPIATGPPSAAAFVQNLGGTLAGDGFRVGATPGAAARAAGLQPGDVIQRINDGAVADLLANPAALSAIAAAGSARLEVLRGAQRLTLVVPLR